MLYLSLLRISALFYYLLGQTPSSMCTHMSCLIDNTGVSNSFMHMVSTTQELASNLSTSLYEIHLVILILSCTMENNPLLMDMCVVVMLISQLFLALSRSILEAFINKLFQCIFVHQLSENTIFLFLDQTLASSCLFLLCDRFFMYR